MRIHIAMIISPSPMINGGQSQKPDGVIATNEASYKSCRVSGSDNSASLTPITPEIDEISLVSGRGKARARGMRRNTELQFLSRIPRRPINYPPLRVPTLPWPYLYIRTDKAVPRWRLCTDFAVGLCSSRAQTDSHRCTICRVIC